MELRMLVDLVLDRQQRRFGDLIEITDARVISGLLESRLAEPATPPNWDAREQLRRLWVRSWRR